MMKAFSVFDRKSESFQRPFFMPSKGAALRAVADEVNRKSDENNMLAKHPMDFALYAVGEFNEQNGDFNGHPPELVCASFDELVYHE